MCVGAPAARSLRENMTWGLQSGRRHLSGLWLEWLFGKYYQSREPWEPTVPTGMWREETFSLIHTASQGQSLLSAAGDTLPD